MDKSLWRNINQLQVHCPNKSAGDTEGVCAGGCEWRGELGKVEFHLNAGERHGDCQWLSVGCMYGCGHYDLRSKLSSHEVSFCPKRPYSCDYCNNYESTCEDVIDRHWKECEKYPVPCPNQCKKPYLCRGDLPNHLTEECEKHAINCPFQWAGCLTTTLRCELNQHLEAETSSHLVLVCNSTTSLIDKFASLTSTVEELLLVQAGSKLQIASLEKEVAVLKQERQLQETSTLKLKSDMSSMEESICRLVATNASLKSASSALWERINTVEEGFGVPPFSFKMEDFTMKKRRKEDWLSPPFYTSLHGYRMCIRVSSNGQVIGEGTHISLTAHIMRGLFDESLNWPFRGDIHIALCNQLEDKDHHESTISFNRKASVYASGRATLKEMNTKGIVLYEFLDHTLLKANPSKGLALLLNDTLHFRVLSVKVCS